MPKPPVSELYKKYKEKHDISKALMLDLLEYENQLITENHISRYTEMTQKVIKKGIQGLKFDYGTQIKHCKEQMEKWTAEEELLQKIISNIS